MNDNDLDMMGDGPMQTLADVAAQAEKTPPRHFVRPETGSEDRIGPTFGPFNEFIQLTYGEIRVGPDGEPIGHIGNDGCWHFFPTYRPNNKETPLPCNRADAHNCPDDYSAISFSDVVIWAE